MLSILPPTGLEPRTLNTTKSVCCRRMPYVEALTTSRATAFCELACVRQDMGCLGILSFVHHSHSHVTECDCNAHKARCAADWGMPYELPDTVEIRAMEEQESQGWPIDSSGPVVFQPPNTQDSQRRLSGTLTDYQIQTLRRCATLDPIHEARHIVASVDPTWVVDINSPESQQESRDDTELVHS
jgi:hypothetical protein